MHVSTCVCVKPQPQRTTDPRSKCCNLYASRSDHSGSVAGRGATTLATWRLMLCWPWLGERKSHHGEAGHPFRESRRQRTFFLKNPGNSPYYETINALWQVEPASDREKFFKWAQQKWAETYAVDEKARETLLGKARDLKREATRLAPPFVLLSDAPVIASSSRTSTLVPEEDGSHSSQGPEMPSEASPLATFCHDLGVDKDKFFSPEISGQSSFMQSASDVARIWTVFQKERRLYHDTSSFRWKKSLL